MVSVAAKCRGEVLWAKVAEKCCGGVVLLLWCGVFFLGWFCVFVFFSFGRASGFVL